MRRRAPRCALGEAAAAGVGRDARRRRACTRATASPASASARHDRLRGAARRRRRRRAHGHLRGRRRAHRAHAPRDVAPELRARRVARGASSSRRNARARRDRAVRHARTCSGCADGRTPCRRAAIRSISPAGSRSSPAAAPAWALPSRAVSPPPARASSSTAAIATSSSGGANARRRRASTSRRMPFDVTDATAVDAGMARHRARASAPIDILVNNAAMNSAQPLDDFALERVARAAWRRTSTGRSSSRARCCRHEGAPPRQDHQHLLARQRHRPAEHRPVRGEQGRRSRC